LNYINGTALDDDGTGRLKGANGKYAERDIVQFVAFRDFKASGDISRLAAEVYAFSEIRLSIALN
jgi:hypothetical protein